MKSRFYKLMTVIISVFLISINFTTVFAENSPVTDNQVIDSNIKNITYNNYYQATQNYKVNNLKSSKIPREVKGLYIIGNTANNNKSLDRLINLLDTTDLNSLVIDVKEDSGYLTYDSDIEEVNTIKSDKNKLINDIDLVLKKCKEKNIYTIARIVTFKDPYYAGAEPDKAFHRKDGKLWRDRHGVIWVDPYKKEVWEYNIAIAKEAAEKGFNEVQFDYVRFPDNGKQMDREVSYDNPENISKAENIGNFLAYAKEELKDYSVFIGADVFGFTTTVSGDMGIGQQWELITSSVDYICPMMYPSHYGAWNYGIEVPENEPYRLIASGLEDALEKNKSVRESGKNTAIIRPWYQDFYDYGPKEINDQINAGNDAGVREYLMWNARNNYTNSAWTNK